ncbi:MAG: protein jag [Veillonellaceae bacterium]|nr:protein jag [Veillonellaceae bacterium]
MNQKTEFTGKTVEEAIAKVLEAWQVGRGEVEIEVLDEGSKGIFGLMAKEARVLASKVAESSDPLHSDDSDVLPAAVLPLTDAAPEVPPTQAEAAADTSSTQAPDDAPADAGNAEPLAEEAEEQSRKAFFDEAEQEAAAQAGREFLQDMSAAMGLSVMIEKRLSPERIHLHLHGHGLGVLIGKHGRTLDAIQYLTNLVANKNVRGRYFVMLDVEDYRSRREETLQALAQRLAKRVQTTRRPLVLEPMNAYERKIIHLVLQDDPEVYTRSEGEDADRHLVIHYRD